MGHAQVVGINEVVEVGHFNKDVNGVVERKAFNKEKRLIKKTGVEHPQRNVEHIQAVEHRPERGTR